MISNPVDDRSWPVCDVCKIPVKRLDSLENIIDNTVTFTAYCHGEVESSKVDISTLRVGTVISARAFAQKKVSQ